MSEQNYDLIHIAVDKIAISPEDAKAVVQGYFSQIPPNIGKDAGRKIVAEKIIDRYSYLSATSGGITSLAGVIPGVGTAVSVIGGGTADVVATMKLQVDMTMCLATTYGYDLTNEDAKHLTFLIAGAGALEQMATTTGKSFVSKTALKVTDIYLKGATLQAVKSIFKSVGINFTKSAFKKALPFGIGVVIGSSTNYALTKYVGNKALDWFVVNPFEKESEKSL